MRVACCHKIYLLLFAVVCLSLAGIAQGKKAAREAVRDTAINSRHYVFDVQSVASSASGAPPTLSSSYSFRVTPDSIYSDMPYYGSSSFPTKSFTESPLLFTSTKFDYVVNRGERGVWNIYIRFKDVREIQAVTITIGKGGYGTLDVTPVNLQSISFSGSVQR